jgi:hypothetical protein
MARSGTAFKRPAKQQGALTPIHIADDGTEAVRLQGEVIGVVNNKTGIGTDTILTDATLVYDVRLGERVMITQINYGLSTISDSMHCELGFTDQAGGAGSFTALTSYRHIVTGAAIAGFTDNKEAFTPPRRASYSEGARSVTFRVTANDVAAAITLEWSGWIEKE